jgi:GntR family transcriptional regulator, transcriptional repressor for pyruvate dehydrogenase complex
VPFQRIQSEKLASAVVRQIELLILRGILRPGERLPAERELAERLGVSRPSLREALHDLQEAGLLASRAGAGVYVADVLGSAFAPALVKLFATHDEALFDALAFRRDMEGLAAERAARLGSETDLAVIDAAFRKLEAAPPGEAAERDADFHMAILDASHNVVLLHMMRSMYDLLAHGVFYNRQVVFARNTTRDVLLDQHREVNAALQARDGAAARRAIEAHLDYVAAAYRDQRKAEDNEAIARQRLHHDTAR